MAAVTLVSLIPITPGAVGVAESPTSASSRPSPATGLTGEITAAIVIFRAAQWLAPIPLGWILLVIMRGEHWREIAQATGDPEAPAERAGVAASS